VTTQPKNLNTPNFDVFSNNLRDKYPNIMDILLSDFTTGKNIFWATNNYVNLGTGFEYFDEITLSSITGNNSNVILSRIFKNKNLQKLRVLEKAEVFTPAWVCNLQINLVDDNFFGYSGAFNHDIIAEDGHHSWQVTTPKVQFPEGKSFLDYVEATRIEITCGEAPYITSRYDLTTGEFIPIERRIGMLDRKLRVINENIDNPKEWLAVASKAYQSIYAFEWQGDSLFLARESMLNTFIENYKCKFDLIPSQESIIAIAKIISWNIIQMDGLKFVIPKSCHETKDNDWLKNGLKGECKGCKDNDCFNHNGIYCLIMDWKEKRVIRFVDLLSNASVI
jgi:hypothetical protein